MVLSSVEAATANLPLPLAGAECEASLCALSGRAGLGGQVSGLAC